MPKYQKGTDILNLFTNKKQKRLKTLHFEPFHNLKKS